MILQPFHEIVADCEDVKYEDGKIKFFLTINKVIEVPQSAFSQDELKNLAGKRIGIFNYGDGYKLRKIKGVEFCRYNINEEG